MAGFFFTPSSIAPEKFVPFTAYQPGVHEEALTVDECDLLRKIGESRGFQEMAQRHVGGDEDNQAVDVDSRSVDCHEVPIDDETLPIVQRLAYAIEGANTWWWNFDLSLIRQLNVLRYRIGHEYMTHIDLNPVRPLVKLSAVVLLNEPNEFEGGAFEYMDGDQFVPVAMNKGTIAVFPSYLPHRVTKVEHGERWSLATWVEGPRFR